ncbi:hypothetical protein [Naasia aerilata]|uniref:Uncharacterized protein n=1 Tax=Naasia aerilata TaxID=1162966 RepID=A0ABN6XR24_9MICO|nr:hypothetical protein [Naasia aerilata]BDZ47444.1 hypothetical protein GCM10025866_33530 [Naasia aerilata]
MLLLTAGTAATPTSAASLGGPYCAIGADPMVKGQAQPVDVDCFATQEAVWEFVTGTPLPADGAPSRSDVSEYNASVLDSSSVAAVGGADSVSVAAAQVVLGAEFQDINLTGPNLYLYASSGSGCGSGATYGFPNLSNWGWNDRVSSATAYAGCRSQHYADDVYRGASVTCSPTCWSMPTLNDAATSIVFRP